MLNVLYTFNRSAHSLRKDQVVALLAENKSGQAPEALINLLIWFGFLGVQELGQDEPTYSYQVRYNVEKLLTVIERGRATYVIHPTFRRALQIVDQG